MTAIESKKEKVRIPDEMVRNFVASAHMDFDTIKEMLEKEPGLLYAAWNWGNEDWETALGAASHVGRKDIALYLIEKGARMDIFTAAMLGNVDIVKTMLDSFPEMIHAKGPHGIPLIVHAQMGGEEAKSVFDYLISLEQVRSN
ncbi:hypothetical protein SAMN04487866_102162 [Thermoactinomyces sp. DSM 45891]|uniref:ankyrin repeat domain-containing protein n=1 Tax=Thermoactinomyces sp. DSM 45891 TaxID=1761907 RepID=UPI000918FF06|nr:ankyrin repeat domain-containing protein [Thermoactinomyces sp. DSM 45891]SFX20772.1 hypothetical protein SAMN04487866_102162 [Thermoactinomyces sp. DSM 45891]